MLFVGGEVVPSGQDYSLLPMRPKSHVRLPSQ